MDLFLSGVNLSSVSQTVEKLIGFSGPGYKPLVYSRGGSRNQRFEVCRGKEKQPIIKPCVVGGSLLSDGDTPTWKPSFR